MRCRTVNVKLGAKHKPLAYKLYDSPIKPERIEEKSFEAIDEEARNYSFSKRQWVVVRRIIHTTADFSLMDNVKFSPHAIDAAIDALGRGCAIYTDSNMIRSGISTVRLKSVFADYSREKIFCHVADEDVAEEAKKAGLPRSLFAVRKAKEILNGGIAVFGNSPVALMELSRMVMEGEVKPAMVVAMPVGFIHVVESKEEFMSLDVPYIAVSGRRGGSTLAVSVINSLCNMARDRAL